MNLRYQMRLHACATEFFQTFHTPARLSGMGTNIRVCCWIAVCFLVGICLPNRYIHGQAPAPATRLPVSIPFDFANNQVFLKVGINSAKPVWFVLDSGASGCVIDAALAQQLGLKVEGEKQGTGAGKGTVTVRFAAWP